MMRQFILFKTLLQLKLLSNRSVLGATVILLSTLPVHAEPVQRWQDNKGQWHFGDQAASIGRKTESVMIKNPISVVKNDVASTLSSTSTVNKSKKLSGKSKRTHSPQQTPYSASTSHKQQCATLREQVYRQPVSGKASQVRQNLVRQYEQKCIAGNYYGN